jgi:hypothetical protein
MTNNNKTYKASELRLRSLHQGEPATPARIPRSRANAYMTIVQRHQALLDWIAGHSY